jgi:hypothetical protein
MTARFPVGAGSIGIIVKTSDDAPVACRNCDADVLPGQAYCGICGQKYVSERLSLQQIGSDLLHAVTHVDRSALSLVRMLLLRPGNVALEYVHGRRKRYFGPFSFLVVIVAAASALVAITGFRAVSSDTPNVVVDFLQSHINLLMFAELPLLAVFSRILDVRAQFNLAEHLVLAAYTSSMRVIFASLIVIPFWFVFHPANAAMVAVVSLVIWALYFGFASSQFFPGSKLASWCRGILTAILSGASMQGLIILVAVLFGRPDA